MPTELTPKEEFELKRAYNDAAEKVAALPNRLKDEFQQAEAENREPFDVTPLTEIPAKLVVYAIDKISGDVAPELAYILGVQRKSCAQHVKAKVTLLSEQLKMILDAAGLGGGNAKVQG